jgi:hypothetical protein
MPEPGTIPLDVPGAGQLEISRCNDKKAVAIVASCGDEEAGVPHRSGGGNRRRWKRVAWRRAVSWTGIEVRVR